MNIRSQLKADFKKCTVHESLSLLFKGCELEKSKDFYDFRDQLLKNIRFEFFRQAQQDR